MYTGPEVLFNVHSTAQTSAYRTLSSMALTLAHRIAISRFSSPSQRKKAAGAIQAHMNRSQYLVISEYSPEQMVKCPAKSW